MRLVFFSQLLFSIFISFSLSAQNIPRLDSLRTALSNSAEISQQSEIMYQLSEGWAESNFDSAFYYASAILKSTAGKSAHMKGYRALALAYDYQYQPDSAETYYKRSLELATELNDTLSMGLLHFNLGTLRLLAGNYVQVLPFYEKALQLLEGKEGAEFYLSKIYTNLGIVYRRTKRYDDALKVYGKAAGLLHLSEHPEALGELYINTANAWKELEAYDSARFYYSEALTLAKQLQDNYMLYYASNGLGIISYEQKLLEDALRYFKPAAQAEELADKNLRITALGYLGSINQELNRPALAEKYFAEASEYVDEEGFPDQTMAFYLQLAEFYEQKGNALKALEYFRKHYRLSNQLLSEEVVDKTAEWEERFKNQEKEKEIISLQLQNEETVLYARQQENQRNVFLFLVVLLVMLAGFSFFLLYVKKRSNLVLLHKNQLIEQALADKEMLMKELHHRVKNNLQVISSLLNLQSNYLRNSPANAAVLESKNRVHAMALIHQTLYQESNQAVIDAEQYLEQLIDNLEQSYQSIEKNIVLKASIDPLRIDVDKMILLGLIVNELLTNAYKYAFEGLSEGRIEVKLKAAEDKVVFSMADNGVGMQTKADNSDGLGMLLIRDFARKLGGALQFSSAGGTQVEMVMDTKMLLV